MEKFIKKLAYWDGSHFLKKSLAQGATDNRKLILEKLKESQASLLDLNGTLSALSSKNPGGKNYLYEYLLSADGEKHFSLLKRLSNYKFQLENILSSNPPKYLESWIKNSISLLKSGIEKISAKMGNAITELSIKNDNENLSKLSKMIESAKIPDNIAITFDRTSVPYTSPEKTDWARKFMEDILCNISDISKIKELSQARISQIGAQSMSQEEKDSLLEEAKETVYNAIKLITNLREDIGKNIHNPKQLSQIKNELMQKIESERFPENVKKKVILEISKITKEFIEQLKAELANKPGPLSEDLSKAFPSLTEGLFDLEP